MSNDSTRQSVLFPDLFGKRLVAKFDQPHGSSDGGAVLLAGADRRLGGLLARLAQGLRDGRQAAKVSHTLGALIAQRTYAIACGYADGNDAGRLAQDPIHKLLAGRDPLADERPASQPTLSRFENAVGPKALLRMCEVLADTVIARHRRRLQGRKVKRITVDLDPTDDPTHGAQQLSFFNGHYDSACYLPMAAFLSFNEEAEQYLCAAVLRPGNATATRGASGLLRRLLGRLKRAFPQARLLVRLDGGFAAPEIFAFLEAQNVEYVVGMAKNAVLERAAAPLMETARARAEASGETAHVYGECRYAAHSWPHRRRVIIKAEVVCHPGRAPRDNPRFVVTNLRNPPRHVYETLYCARGDVENRIKELHHGLEIDRTSCTRFWANQLRVLLTAAAYVLLQELRISARRTACARAQVSTLRQRLLKLGAWVECSVRRIVLHLPVTAAWRCEWQRIARVLGAVPG
jgi:hypothetical protein